MKTCAFCFNRLEDSAFSCICGRSLFVPDEKHKTYPNRKRKIMMDMLRNSRKNYSQTEIETISFGIELYCKEENVEIDESLISMIAEKLDNQVDREIQIEEAKRVQDLEQAQKDANRSAWRNQILERSAPIFCSDRSREVERPVFIETLADILGLSFIKNIVPRFKVNRDFDYKIYSDNVAFWEDMQKGQLREGQQIALSEFHIMEWMPYAPDRYHLPESAKAREQAKQYFSWTNNEYLPLGKENMVLGGIGSVKGGKGLVHDSPGYSTGQR